MCFNHQNIPNGKVIGPNCQNNYDQLQKQLGFHPSKDPKMCTFILLFRPNM